MSLESQLTRIANAKEAIRQVLILYELDVPTSVKIESYASLVRSLLPPKGSVTQAMSRIGVGLEEIPIANISETVSVTTAAPVIGNPTQSMASVVVSLGTIPISSLSESVSSLSAIDRNVLTHDMLANWTYTARYVKDVSDGIKMVTSWSYDGGEKQIDSGRMISVETQTSDLSSVESIVTTSIVRTDLVTLVQNAEGYSDTTSLTLTMENCTVGNKLVIAYANRGLENTVTVGEGWTVLGGGNNASSPSGSDQRVFFASKDVVSATETISLTQATAGRFYVVAAEFSGAESIQIKNSMAARGESNFTVQTSKESVSNIILYAVSSAYYTTSGEGRRQASSPSDLVKLQGNSTQERLACFFDNHSGAITHTFSTTNESGSGRDAIVEAIQITPANQNKCLYRSGSTIYTKSSGALVETSSQVLASTLFESDGVSVDDFDTNLAKSIPNPEFLIWQSESGGVPSMNVSVVGLPPSNQVVVTSAQDMSSETIFGIDNVECVCSDDVRFAFSFDGGTTWKYYDGSAWTQDVSGVGGMTKTVAEGITGDIWDAAQTSDSYKIRFVLPANTSYVTSIIVNYRNSEVIEEGE